MTLIWYAQGANPYPVAELVGGEVVLTFGAHKGAVLREVPASYLTWAARQAFVPEDLRELLRAQLAEAHQEDAQGEDLEERFWRWCGQATVGELADHAAGLRRFLAMLEAELNSRTEAAGAHVDLSFWTQEEEQT